MKVFLSWSGERSKGVASALSEWLPDVFQGLETWMSDHDIQVGSRWLLELTSQLEASQCGILCLTPENLQSPWLLFEAGSLAKALSASRVIPYRLDVSAADVGFPLAQFQGVDTDESGTLKLVRSINDEQNPSLAPDRVDRIFRMWWPILQQKLQVIKPLPGDGVRPRADRAILEEILDLVRQQNNLTEHEIHRAKEVLAWKTIDELTDHQIRSLNNNDLDDYARKLKRAMGQEISAASQLHHCWRETARELEKRGRVFPADIG